MYQIISIFITEMSLLLFTFLLLEQQMSSPNSVKSMLLTLMSEHKFITDIPDFYLLSFSYLLEGENVVLEGFPLDSSIRLVDLFIYAQAEQFHRSGNVTLVCFGSNTRQISKIPDLNPITWTQSNVLPTRHPILEISQQNLEKLIEDKKSADLQFRKFAVTLVLFEVPEMTPHFSVPDRWQIVAIPLERCEYPCTNNRTFVKVAKNGKVTKIERVKASRISNLKESSENTKTEVTNTEIPHTSETGPVHSHSNSSIFLTSLLRSHTNLIIEHILDYDTYIEHISDSIDLKLKKLQVVVYGNSPSICLLFKKFVAAKIKRISSFFFAGGDHGFFNTYMVNNNIQLLFINTENLHSILRKFPMLIRHCKVIMGFAIEEFDATLPVQDLIELHHTTDATTQCVVITTGDMGTDHFMSRPFYHLKVSEDVRKNFTVDLYH